MAVRIIEPPRLGRGRLVATPGPSGYSTTFPLTESPMVEDGGWIMGSAGVGSVVNTASGLAKASVNNHGAFNDSLANRAGAWTNNQYGQGTIAKGTTSGVMEVEILLRWVNAAGASTGIECNLAHDGSYAEIVRWNGAAGDFTILVHTTAGLSVPANGNLFYAECVGNIVTAKLNGATIHTFDISASGIGSGSPGFGFFNDDGAAFDQYAFTDFQAGQL